MDRLMMVASCLALASLGVFVLVCATAILWRKAKRLSIWKMPRLRLAVLAGACAVATIAAQKTVGVRYVDANAPAGGNGLSWNTAARTIDEVSRDLSGGTIYVKPGTYGAFSYWTVEDYMSSNPLKIIATGGVEETIINGNMTVKSDVLTPTWTTLRLSGFTVSGISDAWCVDFDRCVVSNCHEMAAYGSAFNNCLLTENASMFLCCTYSGCTVVRNSGSCITAGASAAWNSIFWNNSSDNGMPNYDILAATNCCMDVMREGTGNFSGDPLFVDAENGNYRLAEGSPCIDAGDDASATGDRDLTGKTRILDAHVDVGAYEFVPPQPPPRLVYRSTLDSEYAVVNPLVGAGGTCSSGATFVEGRLGAALYVPAYACVVQIPLPDGLPPERGCIEFWAKLEGNKTTYGDGGDPMLIHLSRGSASDQFGRIEFNSNNGGGKSGLGMAFNGLSAYSFDTYGRNSYAELLPDTIFDWHHYALVWNVDGISSLSGNPRVALLLDGNDIARANAGGTWRKSEFVAGMAQPLTLDLSCPSTGSGKSPYAIDELRIWDSDVTTFNHDEEDTGARFVDARAPAGGNGLSWSTAARTIDEVSRDMDGGVIYVKSGTYGAFAFKKPSAEGEPLRVIATGSPSETVIDGAGTQGIQNLNASAPRSFAPSPDAHVLYLNGFTVRNMGVQSSDQVFDRCVISNFTKGVATASAFRNCLIVGNESNSSTGLLARCWLDNCTVTGNRSNPSIGLVGVARNSVIWGNSGASYYGLVATNCCLECSAQGTGNVFEDPLFVDAGKGDYRLAEGSPCIDAGDNASVSAGRDLAGNMRVHNGTVDIGAYETLPPVTLVYRSTLDSESAVSNPLVGAGGTCNGATFVEGKFGSALHVPAHSDVATIPLPGGLPPARGCIEFWAKLQEGKSYYYDGGDPIFIRVFDAETGLQVFSFEFNANNGGGRGGICAGFPGMSIAPESYGYSKPYSGTITEGSVSDWHRFTFVWNVDGIDAVSGEPNAVILVDGQVKASTTVAAGWDRDGFLALLARPLNLAFNQSDSGHGKSSFSIDELRIWDSDAAMFRGFPSLSDVSYVYDGQPHSLRLPSGGVDEVAIRYSLSEDGPFVDEMPTLTDAGTMCVWYVVSADDLTVVASATVTVSKRPVAFASASAEKPYDGTPLTNGTVSVAGVVPDGEGFTFSVTGAQTVIGESENAFTWTANEGTNPDNYEVSVTYGRLNVTVASEYAGSGYEVVHGPSGDVVRITHLDAGQGGDVTLPDSFGGLPVVAIAAEALSGSNVTGVRVPPGVMVEGALFNGLQSVSNVSFAAGSSVTGTLSFCGCASLREVVMPAQALLTPHAFLGCWSLERVVFAGEPPFGNEAPAGSDEVALLVASVRPATLLQMADTICYPEAYATRWEKSLRNFGYGGRYGAYAGEWTGEESLVAGSGNLDAGPPGAGPSGEPAAQYAAQTGRASDTVIAGAAGWDALGVPDGMTWDRTTGTLGGTPKRSGTYDVILVSGSGTSTKMMRTTLEVAGYAVTTGYVGTAFKVSGAPWNALASYKTVPAGLAWKSKVLSGVPTKAGAWTYKTKDGEPVKVAILALPAGAKGTFNGVVADAAGKRYPLKLSATAAGKLSATVAKGAKTYSLKATKWSKVTAENVEGIPHRMFNATLTAKGLSLSVKVDVDAVWNADALTAAGTLGAVKGLAGTAQRNAFASDDAAKSVAAARAGSYSLSAQSDNSGGWILVQPAEGAKGALTVVLKSNGTATLSGTLPNKTKVDTSSTLHVAADGAASLRFHVKGAWIAYTW